MRKTETLIKPIAYIYTDMSEKFGIPRQSGLVEELRGKIVFESEYRNVEAVREIEGFSHLWLIWQFSEHKESNWHPTVRPPRLGGNRRVGVFASRSPFRPNNLGLSCVELERVDCSSKNSPVLYVKGVDMLSGTPIYDIKPYVPVADLKPEAREGYTAETREHSLQVVFENTLEELVPAEKRKALRGILSGDPRPGYDEEGKEYGLSFSGLDIGFKVKNETVVVFRITRLEK